MKKGRFGNFIRRNKWQVISFCTALVIALIIFLFAAVWPMGQRSTVAMDMWGQYYPMLRELKTMLKNGNLFWSWDGGLGFDYISQYAYYTASPFWLLTALLPNSLLTAGIHIVTLLRMALSALTFSVFLRYKYKKESLLSCAFSVAYGLSAYALAFINQIMWMDAIVLLPLVAMGIERLREHKPMTYFLSLGLTLFSNFYIGFMVCIFSVLYFFACEISEAPKFGNFIMNGLRFALWSLLAGGAAAFLLIPTYLSIGRTIASTLTVDGIEMYHNFVEFIENMMPLTKVSLEFGVPNLYCGILPALVLPAYIFCRKVPLRRRITMLVFAAFMLISFNFNILDYIWHGFHFPNQLPGRQSFIYIFIVLVIGFEAMRNIRSCEPIGLIFLPVMTGYALWVAYIGKESSGIEIDMIPLIVGTGCMLVLVPALALLMRTNKAAVVRTLGVLIPLFMLAETTVSGSFVLTWTGFKTKYDDIASLDGRMAKATAKYESDGTDFYRTEWFPLYQFNPGQMYGFKGITYYSSMMTSDAYLFWLKCGSPIYAKNVSTKYTQTPITNSLFGIRYIYDRASDPMTGLEKVETIDKVNVMEYGYRLPVAFMTSEAIRDFIGPDEKHVEFQNEMFRATGAADSDMFERLKADEMDYENCTIASNEDKLYYYRIDKEEPVRAFYEFTADRDGEYYVNLKFKAGNLIVSSDIKPETTYDISKNSIVYVGNFKEGEKIHIRFVNESSNYALYGCELYYFNTEAFSAAIDTLRLGGCSVTKATSNRIEADINAGDGGFMFASIPYSDGWTLTCDGNKVDLVKAAGYLTGAELPAGEHKLVFSYVTPGFVPGAIIAAVCIAAAVLIKILYEKKYYRKAEAK